MRKISPRHIAATLLLVSALSPACARLGAGTSVTGSGSGVSAADALSQAQGCATALAELTKTGPMDDATKAQVGNWGAWLDFALKAAGIVVTAVGL